MTSRDLAAHCEFEEVAQLAGPWQALHRQEELVAYKSGAAAVAQLARGGKADTRVASSHSASHGHLFCAQACPRWDCVVPEGINHGNFEGARTTLRFFAPLGSMLLYWHHYARNGRRIEVERFEDSIAAHFLHLLHEGRQAHSGPRRCKLPLILYAEHEFNSVHLHRKGECRDRVGSILVHCWRDWGAERSRTRRARIKGQRWEVEHRYASVDEAEADIGPPHRRS